MAIKMRDVEKNGDTKATVADLIHVIEKEEKDITHSKEEQTYQWNNFVRDFMNDELSKKYKDPMKVAAILWKLVRNSNQEKKYSHELMIKNNKLIEMYLK